MEKTLKTLAVAAMTALATAACTQPQQAAGVQNSATEACGQGGSLRIAYVNTDSIMANYKLAVRMNDELQSKMEDSRAILNQKARAFAQNYQSFQQKVQNNAFLSLERAQKEQDKLQKEQAELQEQEQKLSYEFQQKQVALSAQLNDSVRNFLAGYGKDKFLLILSNSMGDNVLYAAPGVDITDEVVSGLNARIK